MVVQTAPTLQAFCASPLPTRLSRSDKRVKSRQSRPLVACTPPSRGVTVRFTPENVEVRAEVGECLGGAP